MRPAEQEARARFAGGRRQPHRAGERRARGEGGGVDRDRPARPGSGDDPAADRCAEHGARVQREPEQSVRLLGHRRGHGLRHDRGRGGEEERRRRPVHGADGDHVPELGVVREEQCRQRPLARAAEHAGGDHHVVARQAVGPDPADQEEDDLGCRACREDVSQVGLRAGQMEDCECERDRSHRIAEEGHGPPEEEQAELALDEWPEAGQVASSRLSQ
jgi:hypothetical protein